MWFAAAAYGQFASELSLGGDVDIAERMVVASFGRRFGDTSVRVAAGAILGGSLKFDGRTHDIGVGWLATVSAAHRWLLGPQDRWFVSSSVTAGMSSTSTSEGGGGDVSLRAVDFRVGVLGGVTVWERVSPYLLARAFLGPVSWTRDGETVTGADQHHFQLGAGVSVRLPANVSVLVDASFLGERSLSLGASIGF